LTRTAKDQRQRQRDMQTVLTTLTADPNLTAKQVAAALQWTDNHARSILYALETVGKVRAYRPEPVGDGNNPYRWSVRA